MGLCNVRPPIDRRTVHKYNKCDYLERWVQTKNHRVHNHLVYVCSDVLGWFVDTILPRVSTPFVLVSGDSDKAVPREAMTNTQVQKLVECVYCCAWYAQNWVGVGASEVVPAAMKKVVSLPIGMDYHTLTMGHGPTPIEQERMLQEVRAGGAPFLARRAEIFCNVQHRLDRWGDRERAIRAIPPGLAVFSPKMDREATWREMVKYRYILSPFGNGYDCHRVWESLLLGCVPIVCCGGGGKAVREYKRLWEGLPVLCVDRWSDVTEKVLADYAALYCVEKGKIHEYLRLEWWRNKMHNEFDLLKI
jgi:hypothetical protein